LAAFADQFGNGVAFGYDGEKTEGLAQAKLQRDVIDTSRFSIDLMTSTNTACVQKRKKRSKAPKLSKSKIHELRKLRTAELRRL
jgi:hypothetical protein